MSIEITNLSNEESHRLTIESIETALLQLMQEHNLKEISVTQIVKRAGVSRGAFYRNYDTKEDVLRAISKRHGKHIYELLHAGADNIYAPDYWAGMFAYARKHHLYFTALVQNQQEAILHEAVSYVTALSRENLTEPPFSPYVLSYMTGAISRVFYDWIAGGMIESPQKMSEFLCVMTRK